MPFKPLVDIRTAYTFATHTWRGSVPKRATPQQIAAAFAAAGIEWNASYEDLRQREYELQYAHALGVQLATLAAAEGYIRELALQWVANRADVATEKLRKLLSRLDMEGLPDSFRSLVETFSAAVDLDPKERAAWTNLLDYRNWLAHGQGGEPPRQIIPDNAALDQEIDGAVTKFRRAVKA